MLSIIDTDKIVRDRLQLWAEAMHVFQVDGIPQADAERLAKAEHATFAPEDPLRDRIAAWLDQHMDPDGEGVTWRHSRRLRMADLMVECLGVDLVKLTPAARDRDRKRYGAILTTRGMVKRVRRMNGKNTKVWINQRG